MSTFDNISKAVKPEYVLDGRHTTTLELFYSEMGRVLLDGQS